MDRKRLERWLTAGHRTWRWRKDDDPNAYEAVETTDAGLAWYRWSHEAAGGGERDRTLQTYEAFRSEGPLRDMPDTMEAELRRWVEGLNAGGGM